jgi:1-acyl-sn-glycerol-3-phosphate acyltransferase
MIRSWIKRVFILVNLVAYWGILPCVLTLAADRVDRALGLPRIPAAIAIGPGAFFLAAGLLFSLWTVATLYMRGGGLPIALLPPHRLVREGPYALSRHPLYFAFTIYLVGWGALACSTGFFAVVLPGFTLLWIAYSLGHEEPVLTRRFGKDYRAYKKETPFFLRLQRGYPGPGVLFALVYSFGKVLLRVFFPITVVGREHVPKVGPALIAANHACYLDPIFLIAASDRYIRFFTTAEMMNTSIGRWLFTRLGSIPIHRYRNDPQGVRELLRALKEKEIIGLFPEGERSWDGNPLPVSDRVKKWAKFPLPGRIVVRFHPTQCPPFSEGDIESLLRRIAAPSGGRTALRRSPVGIEKLLWACPDCHAIGSIFTEGPVIGCKKCHATWQLDRELTLHSADGKSIPLAKLSASLDEKESFAGKDSLLSIGKVELLEGRDRLRLITSGTLSYRKGNLSIEDHPIPLHNLRSLTIEGKNRLDIGFRNGERMRLSFRKDSPLKWQRFLADRLKQET